MINVRNGVNEMDWDLDGQTVANVRKNLAQVFNVDPKAATYVNGEEVTPSHVLRDGDELEFVKSSGIKGC